jgi:hypothetical protein
MVTDRSPNATSTRAQGRRKGDKDITRPNNVVRLQAPPPKWRSGSHFEFDQCLVELEDIDVGRAQETQFRTLRLLVDQPLEHAVREPGGLGHHRKLRQRITGSDVRVDPAARRGHQVRGRLDPPLVPVGDQDFGVALQFG